MRARLIIKGDRFQAARAAADRGLGFAFLAETEHDTVGYTEGTAELLDAWLTEKTNPPFQPGTLLLWTPIGESCPACDAHRLGSGNVCDVHGK